MTEQQQAWAVDKIEPHPRIKDRWRVVLRDDTDHTLRYRTTDELVAAGITPPRPPIVVTSGGRSIELDPNDVAEWVAYWERQDPATGFFRRVGHALANLLTDQEPT